MRIAAAMAVVVLVGGGCADRPQPRPLEPLTIAAGTIPDFSLIHLASDQGYFAAEGLAVTVQPHQFGKLALSAVLDGKADLAASAETPVVFAELRGHRLSVLASIGTSTTNMALVALKGAGIKGPADLAGKRIAVTPGTSGAFFLDTLLLRHGVARGSVHLVELKPDAMEDALARGEVAAAATWSPTVQLLQRRFGASVLTFHEADLYAETAVLTGRRGFAEAHPEAAQRVLRALLRAETLFREDPRAARLVMERRYQDQPGLLSEMIEQFDFRVRLDQSLLVLLEEEGRWASRLGAAPAGAPVNFLESLAPAPLLAVEPTRVGLIQ